MRIFAYLCWRVFFCFCFKDPQQKTLSGMLCASKDGLAARFPFMKTFYVACFIVLQVLIGKSTNNK